MAVGGGGGTLWIKMLVGGGALVAAGNGLHHGHVGPTWLVASLLAVGGLAVVFGSCEAMIKCVEGIAQRAGWNEFVAGTIGGLASNVPEVVMLGFVIASGPRVGFIVVAFTLHVGAMAFGVYSGLLPRDTEGHARLPKPLVKLSTDLYACAAGIMLATGSIMLAMVAFDAERGGVATPALTPTDLYVMGAMLLMVQVVAVTRLVQRFSVADPRDAEEDAAEVTGASPAGGAGSEEGAADVAEQPPSVGAIIGYGVLGVLTSLVGGHAVGDFAGMLVAALTKAGYSEMVGALVLAVFACAGAYAMAATAHAKGSYDIALAAVSGQITQVPFLVMPISLIMIAAFSQLGVTPALPGGAALPIDLHTTSVLLLGFPPMLLLWKAVQDDGKVSWIETATMVAVFALTLYFLASHG